MRKVTASLFLLSAFAASIAALDLPLPLLGKVQSDSPIESAVVVRNEGGDLFCVYAASKTLHVSRRLASGGDFSPYAIGLPADIAGVRDIKAFNRFGNIWMVFFVAADASGNEAVRAMEFDSGDNLVYSPYGAFDDPLAGRFVREYSVYQDEILSFYVALQKEGGITVLYAGHDRDNRTLLRERQSLDERDISPINMLCQKGPKYFEIAADYIDNNQYHCSFLALAKGKAVLRTEIGSYSFQLRSFSAYSAEGLERVVFVRGNEVSAFDYVGGGKAGGSTWYPTGYGSNVYSSQILSPNIDVFFTTAGSANAVEMTTFVAGGDIRPVGQLPGCTEASVGLHKGAGTGPEYLVFGRDAAGLRQIERLRLNIGNQQFVDWNNAVTDGGLVASGNLDRSTIISEIFDERKSEYSLFDYEPANSLISWRGIVDSGTIQRLSAHFLTSSPPDDLFMFPFILKADSPTLVAESAKYVIVLDEKDTATWVSRGSLRDGVTGIVASALDSNSLVVFSTGK